MRLQEPIRVTLADERVILSGRLDLVLGAPTSERAGATLIDIKSGTRRIDDITDAGWYAVLETLRHGVPPFQSGNYYLRDGILDLSVVDSPRVQQAAARIVEGVGRLLRLATGHSSTTTPNALCQWCSEFTSCEPGQRYMAERDLEIGLDRPSDDERAYYVS